MTKYRTYVDDAGVVRVTDGAIPEGGRVVKDDYRNRQAPTVPPTLEKPVALTDVQRLLASAGIPFVVNS